MKPELRDRGVLLTGASSGIGRATASAMGKHGARLALAARTESALHELADEIVAAGGHPPTVIRADLSARGAAAEVAVRATEALGEVEILVNNAGGGVAGSQWAVADGDPAREALRGEPLVPARADARSFPGCANAARARSSTSPRLRRQAPGRASAPTRRRRQPSPWRPNRCG